MVFSSLLFLVFFLPSCLILHSIASFGDGLAAKRLGADCACSLRNAVLLIFSLTFYAWGEPKCVLLMMFSSLVDYVDGRLQKRFDDNNAIRTACLVCSLVINFSLLGIFKYADFFVGMINNIPGVSLALPGIALPIGISFYTFQTASYSIDVYRREVEPEDNYLRYLTYVSLFPQLIAGPIVRYKTVQRELKHRRADFTAGLCRFLVGLFRKVLIANQLGELWEFIKGQESLSVPAAWLGLFTFTLQLYFDFSAYSDMAIGLGRMFGFHFLENFNYPLSARSMTEFWRRWHISLSGWFRDYLYIPLGGNRKGRTRQLVNLFIVWFLTGLWHGASWNFVIWGLYHGVFLVLEKFVYGKVLEKAPGIIRHLYAIVITVIGFGIFAFEDLRGFLIIMGSALGLSAYDGIEDFLWAWSNYMPTIVAACVLSFPLFPFFAKKVSLLDETQRKVIDGICAVSALGLFILCLGALVTDSYNPFLYFRF